MALGVISYWDGVPRKAYSATSQTMDYQMQRLFKVKSDGGIAFFYCIKGELDNCTLGHLNSLDYFLRSRFEADCEEMFNAHDPTVTDVLQTRVSVRHCIVYLYFKIKFGDGWMPGGDFKEVK